MSIHIKNRWTAFEFTVQLVTCMGVAVHVGFQCFLAKKKKKMPDIIEGSSRQTLALFDFATRADKIVNWRLKVAVGVFIKGKKLNVQLQHRSERWSCEGQWLTSDKCPTNVGKNPYVDCQVM